MVAVRDKKIEDEVKSGVVAESEIGSHTFHCAIQLNVIIWANYWGSYDRIV